MSPKILSSNEALSDGADLWVLPSSVFSEWTKKLDWPLNLQISRAAHYSSRKPSVELLSILQQNEMTFETEFLGGKNLILATTGLIPADRVVILGAETWESWCKSAIKIWQGLEKPSTRFFLPTFAKWEKVKSSWPTIANIETVQIVTAEN